MSEDTTYEVATAVTAADLLQLGYDSSLSPDEEGCKVCTHTCLITTA